MLAANAFSDAFEVTAGHALNVDGNLTGYSGGELVEVASFAAPGSVAQMEYSADYGVLIVRDDSTAIHVIDVATRLPINTEFAKWSFTDIDLSPDGRYLFASDYGGEITGSDLPARPNYVHGLDLATLDWETKLAPKIAYRIEAVSAQQVLLQEGDQWVDITLNDFGDSGSTSMVELSRIGGDYSGDFKYDHRSGRIIKGGLSRIAVRSILDGVLIAGRDGEPAAYGLSGAAALASDGERFYYGRLQVEADDVTNSLVAFPERIYAATPRLAFGQHGFYDADTGAARGSLGFDSQVYFVSDDGLDVWTFDDNQDKLHHYRPADSRSGVLYNDAGSGALQAELAAAPQHGDLVFRSDGFFTYIANPGFVGTDRFTYIARDASRFEDTAEVLIEVKEEQHSPISVNDDFTINAGETLTVDQSVAYNLPELVESAQFSAGGNVRKLIYAERERLLLLMNDTAIRVVDARTEMELSTHNAVYQFTDIDLSPDGRFLYAADYGGEVIGYSRPARPHYIHRLDLQTFTWERKLAPSTAWQIEAIDERRFLVGEGDQHIEVMLNDFGMSAADPIVELSRRAAGYSGEIEFDPRSGIIYHNSHIASTLTALKVVGDSIVSFQAVNPGSSTPGGITLVLSSNGSALYNGALQVDPLNTQIIRNVFPERIIAASGKIAFGNRAWYDAETSKARGGWGFGPSLAAVSDDGNHLWLFNPVDDTLHGYKLVPATRHGLLANDRDADGDVITATLLAPPQNGDVRLNSDGTFTYTPHSGFAGLDIFTYTATDATGRESSSSVTVNVLPTPVVNVAPKAVGDAYNALAEQPLVVGDQPWRNVANHQVFSFDTQANVLQVEYSPQFDLVFARTAAQVLIYEAATGLPAGAAAARSTFTDMDLTFDGRYLFAADYGGERIGYNAPAGNHYVHRYDLATRTWDIQYLATIAYRLEAVDRNHVLLQEGDQHVDITYNYFADWPGAPIEELSRVNGNYSGDFEYDPRTGFIYNGNSGSSSNEISTRRLVADKLTVTVSSGVYGTAQGYGGSSVLAADGKRFYYGRLQVEALNVRNNLRVFPEVIRAATAQVAFGTNSYYDAVTGNRLGDIGFSATVWFASDDGKHVWAADGGGKLRHFDVGLLRTGVLLNDTDANGDELQVDFYSQPAHGSVSVDAAGAFRYVPASGFVGLDEFNYRVTDSRGGIAVATVRINVYRTIALENLTLKERVAGATVGLLQVFGAVPGEPVTFAVSDGRFEVVDGILSLKSDVSLDALAEPAISLRITATNARFSLEQVFTATVVANSLPWTNQRLTGDVDNDGIIAPIDALIIINELNLHGSSRLGWAASGPKASFFDSSGDGFVSPIDALLIFNHLNQVGKSEWESNFSEAEQVESPAERVDTAENPVDLALAWFLSEPSVTTRKSALFTSKQPSVEFS